MRIAKIFLLAGFLVLIAATIPGMVQAQTDAYYVPETGHWIRGEFLRFYQSADDPLLYYGYPITDEIIDPTNGHRVQYFQRARFDAVEDETHNITIQLASLGSLIYTPGAPLVTLADNNGACREFPSGYSVCYAFLQFYDAHDGAVRFGNPISNLEESDGRYVQYFERVRMEWRPELPSGQRVALTDLGRIYFDKRVGNPELLEPRNASIITLPIRLQTHAFVEKALVTSREDQTLYVIVQDQRCAPVQGAEVRAAIARDNGQVQTIQLPATDADGISKYTFNVGEQNPTKVVEIGVQVTFRELIELTSSWFRVWW